MIVGLVPRGGLSKDPEKAARQLAALRAGQKIARARREGGLPTKRRESRQSPAETAGEGESRGSGKVVPGTYAKEPAERGSRPRANPQPDDHEHDDGEHDDGPSLNRLERAYARVLGIDVG